MERGTKQTLSHSCPKHSQLEYQTSYANGAYNFKGGNGKYCLILTLKGFLLAIWVAFISQRS